MPIKPDRLARVNELLKREIADVMEKYGFNDGSHIVSVTKVRLSTNLRQAAVYVSILGSGDPDENYEKALKRLLKLRSVIQENMAKHVTLKYTPVIHFVHDKNIVEGDHILDLLRELEENE